MYVYIYIQNSHCLYLSHVNIGRCLQEKVSILLNILKNKQQNNDNTTTTTNKQTNKQGIKVQEIVHMVDFRVKDTSLKP